jgi:hypothetical protein
VKFSLGLFAFSLLLGRKFWFIFGQRFCKGVDGEKSPKIRDVGLAALRVELYFLVFLCIVSKSN